MIVLDASVLIAHFSPEDPCHQRAALLLENVANDPIGMSTVTLAEIMVGPISMGRGEVIKTALHRLGITEVPLPEGSAERLARLRVESGLKLPHCCVLLAAQVVSASGVLTFDERLGKRAVDQGFAWNPSPFP